MATATSRLRFLIFPLPLLLVAWTSDAFAQPSATEVNRELAFYRDNLNALETANGGTSPQLVETLEEIADRLMTLAEYAQAHVVLDRAQQIIRINEGLYSASQYRFLQKKIENLANAGDWRKGRKLQDHLFWLYTRKNPSPDENTVADLLKASDMHLRGVVEDGVEFQGYHYRNAAIHSRVALAVAQAIWHPHDLRNGQVIYEQLKHAHLQALEIQQGGNAAMALRSAGYGRELILDRNVVRSIHRGNGYLYLEKLRQLYLNLETPDLEAAAMATLYLADWQVLFQQQELAVVSYADAYAELLEAGVPEQLVDELFVEPSLIPATEFYPTVAAALERRKQKAQFTLAPVHDGPIWLSFDELPELTSATGENDSSLTSAFAGSGAALFSFSLVGVEGITRGRWPRRQLTTLGMAQNLQLVAAETATDVPQDTLIEKFNRLRFRPKLVAGIPVAVTGVISYLAVSDTLN